MKILVFSRVTLSHCKGGMERHLGELTEKLAEKGHSVQVVTTRHRLGIEEETVNGVTFHYLRKTAPAVYSPDYFAESARFAKTIDADVIWSQSGGGLGLVKYRKKLNLQGTPFVTYLHGYSALDPLLHFFQSSLVNLKTGHNSSIEGEKKEEKLSQYSSNFMKFLINYVDTERLCLYSDAIISVTRKASVVLKSTHFLASNRCHLVYNGVDPTVFKPNINTTDLRRTLGLQKNEKVVLSVGRISEGKGIQYLIPAFKMLLNSGTNARLIIVGDGPYRSYLEGTVRKMNIASKVVFTGALNPEELPKFYNLCDVFVFTSILFETFPYVTIEAMACGKPILAFKTGGISEQVTHMHNGLLLRSGDIQSIYRGMLLLIKEKPELALRLGENARKKVIKDFNVNVMTQRIESIFLNLIS